MNPPRILQTSEVAVLCDPENILSLPVRIEEFPLRLARFLRELRKLFTCCGIRLSRDYSRCYLERRYGLSAQWHSQCEQAVRCSGFQVRWSNPRQPAESLMEQEIHQMVQEPSFPNEVYVVSGDGDTIPSVDELRHVAGRRTVCSMARKRKVNRWLEVVANGVIILDEEMNFFDRELI